MRRLLACLLMAACGSAAVAGVSATADGGRWRVVAEGSIVAVYDHGVRVRALDAAGRDGRTRSGVTAIRHLPARRSFVIAFESLAELWELSVDPQAAPIFEGLVHDYRLGEAVAEPGFLGVRRTRLDAPLGELAVDGSGAYVLGRASVGAVAGAELHLVQLDVRRTIGRFRVGGDPDLAAAQTLQRESGPLLRVPDRHGGAATVLDLQRARLVGGEGRAVPPL